MGLIVVELQQLDDVRVLDFPQDIDLIVDEIRFSPQNASLFTGSKKKILNFGRFLKKQTPEIHKLEAPVDVRMTSKGYKAAYFYTK